MSNNIKILFVEDLPTDVALAMRVLSKEGIKIQSRVVEREDDFLHELKEFVPDIIISDYKMPEFDGMRALRLTLDHCPDIPFILVTAAMNEETAVECMKAGASDYIIKEHITRLPFAVKEALKKNEAQVETKQSEEKYRSLFENMLEGVAHCKMLYDDNFQPVDFIYLNVNHSFEQLTGLKNVVGKPVSEVIPGAKELHPEMFKSYNRVASTGKPEKLELYFKPLKQWLSITIYCPAKGFFVTVFDDITERKLADENRRHREAELQESQRIARVGSWDMTISTGVIVWSDGLNHLLARDPSLPSPTFEALSQFFTPESWKRLSVSITKAIETGESYELELEMIRVDDAICWTTTRGEAIRGSDGTVVKLRGTVHDITDQKHAEETKKNFEEQLQQAQKLKSIGTLASGIAHDFNNILGIIMGHSSLYQFIKADPQKVEQSIDAIIKATNRGASLVKQLLTFARETDVIVSSVNVNEIILEIRKLLKEIFPKTIIVSDSLQKDLPNINADAGQIHQVLLNLCVNARDAMPINGTLSISTSVVNNQSILHQFVNATSNKYLRIEIADTGIGMDEKTRLRIFEPFYTTKDIGKGTGLGLSTAFGIVDTFNGFIDVQSVVGKGTTFTIYFPIPELESEIFQTNIKKTKEIRGGTETILLIEDEEVLRELLKSVLAGMGYTVITAEDGQLGVEMYRNHKNEIALVLSDMGLPLLSGQDVAKNILKIKPTAKVVIASGYVNPEIKSVMLQSGIKHFIQKPYSYDEVLLKVREVIDING